MGKQKEVETKDAVASDLKRLVKWPLDNGIYATEKGSVLEVSGKHRGRFTFEFDWLEEDACFDCEPIAIPQYYDGEAWMEWHCDVCSGGAAKITQKLKAT